ncbi:hypothetical protein C3Y92_00280 [Solidesulfovibrio carbinolicus]|uniref:Uncharacterized protein n=1 Tax=Solidesulfovibrio carbinolicus TaxID=296842 RepID=A0A4P6HF29_9BACT|nr:hypothetical protein C3Y92_00280 [Solidesulfovibrio carbinolicus]
MIFILMTVAVSFLERMPFVVVYSARFVDVNDDKCGCGVAVRFEKFNELFFYDYFIAVIVDISKVSIIFVASKGHGCN